MAEQQGHVPDSARGDRGVVHGCYCAISAAGRTWDASFPGERHQRREFQSQRPMLITLGNRGAHGHDLCSQYHLYVVDQGT
jgi:hypothetical protein